MMDKWQNVKKRDETQDAEESVRGRSFFFGKDVSVRGRGGGKAEGNLASILASMAPDMSRKNRIARVERYSSRTVAAATFNFDLEMNIMAQVPTVGLQATNSRRIRGSVLMTENAIQELLAESDEQEERGLGDSRCTSPSSSPNLISMSKTDNIYSTTPCYRSANATPDGSRHGGNLIGKALQIISNGMKRRASVCTASLPQDIHRDASDPSVPLDVLPLPHRLSSPPSRDLSPNSQTGFQRNTEFLVKAQSLGSRGSSNWDQMFRQLGMDVVQDVPVLAGKSSHALRQPSFTSNPSNGGLSNRQPPLATAHALNSTSEDLLLRTGGSPVRPGDPLLASPGMSPLATVDENGLPDVSHRSTAGADKPRSPRAASLERVPVAADRSISAGDAFDVSLRRQLSRLGSAVGDRVGRVMSFTSLSGAGASNGGGGTPLGQNDEFRRTSSSRRQQSPVSGVDRKSSDASGGGSRRSASSQGGGLAPVLWQCYACAQPLEEPDTTSGDKGLLGPGGPAAEDLSQCGSGCSRPTIDESIFEFTNPFEICKSSPLPTPLDSFVGNNPGAMLQRSLQLPYGANLISNNGLSSGDTSAGAGASSIGAVTAVVPSQQNFSAACSISGFSVPTDNSWENTHDVVVNESKDNTCQLTVPRQGASVDSTKHPMADGPGAVAGSTGGQGPQRDNCFSSAPAAGRVSFAGEEPEEHSSALPFGFSLSSLASADPLEGLESPVLSAASSLSNALVRPPPALPPSMLSQTLRAAAMRQRSISSAPSSMSARGFASLKTSPLDLGLRASGDGASFSVAAQGGGTDGSVGAGASNGDITYPGMDIIIATGRSATVSGDLGGISIQGSNTQAHYAPPAQRDPSLPKGVHLLYSSSPQDTSSSSPPIKFLDKNPNETHRQRSIEVVAEALQGSIMKLSTPSGVSTPRRQQLTHDSEGGGGGEASDGREWPRVSFAPMAMGATNSHPAFGALGSGSMSGSFTQARSGDSPGLASSHSTALPMGMRGSPSFRMLHALSSAIGVAPPASPNALNRASCSNPVAAGATAPPQTQAASSYAKLSSSPSVASSHHFGSSHNLRSLVSQLSIGGRGQERASAIPRSNSVAHALEAVAAAAAARHEMSKKKDEMRRSGEEVTDPISDITLSYLLEAPPPAVEM